MCFTLSILFSQLCSLDVDRCAVYHMQSAPASTGVDTAGDRAQPIVNSDRMDLFQASLTALGLPTTPPGNDVALIGVSLHAKMFSRLFRCG